MRTNIIKQLILKQSTKKGKLTWSFQPPYPNPRWKRSHRNPTAPWTVPTTPWSVWHFPFCHMPEMYLYCTS